MDQIKAISLEPRAQPQPEIHPPLEESTLEISPQKVYNGGFKDATVIKLRISNGGAGQAGLIGEWANAFIQYAVSKGSDPFLVGWYLGDTTQSIAFLASGQVDIAVTYNEAAEKQAVNIGAASKRVCLFYDHFLLVGPKSNPAGLDSQVDDILAMFNKIVTFGGADSLVPPDPKVRPPTRFLSRFDKSATNIKESLLFTTIGQVPWAFAYSTWYHQYPMFPIQALEAASLLHEYTLSDRGIWLSSASSVTDALEIYKAGTDDTTDLLINIGTGLVGTQSSKEHKDTIDLFMAWVVREDGGRQVVRDFKKNGQQLYTVPVD